MARWRQCVISFMGGAGGNGDASSADRQTPIATSFESVVGNPGGPPPPRASSEGDVFAAAAPEDYEQPYSVRVDGFQRSRGHIVYTITIRHGDASWPIRRRYREVALLHQRLVQGLGRNAIRDGLPQPPPKVTFRNALFGNYDQRFLQARCAALQHYLDSLLAYIPYVDQCEVLRDFLCTVDQGFMDDYERVLDLEEGIGTAGASAEPLDPSLIAALPRRTKGSFSQEGSACVICQDPLQPGAGDDGEDVRVLPCGHEYHFSCISRWLSQNNSCCVCQSVAIATETAAPAK